MGNDPALYALIPLSPDACLEWLSSVDAYLDSLAEEGPCSMGYDEDESAYVIAMLQCERWQDAISVLKDAARFVDEDRPGYICAFNATGGGDPQMLVEIARNETRTLPPMSDAPNVLYFLNEAEEVIESLLEDEEEE